VHNPILVAPRGTARSLLPLQLQSSPGSRKSSLRLILNRIFLVLALCTISLLASAADKPWTEIRSDHFRVLTDGDTLSGLAIAREFEQMRSVFAMGAQNMRLESGTQLLIFAPRDLTSMSRISSWPNPSSNSGIAGYFHPGWEREFAVIRLDQDRPGLFQPVFHEYVHTLLHINFRWLPLWLDEGLAELYGTSEFKESSALVGVPSSRKFLLERQDLIPLKTLFKVDPSSPIYHGSKTQFFYAESWALSHYLTFAEGMERGQRMTQFYNLLQSETDQEKAFEQVFGPIADVERKLEKYARKGKMQAWEVKNPPEILARNFQVRTLTVPETQAELAGLSLWTSHDLPNAQNLLSQALKADPKLAVAHEYMGFLHFTNGEDEDAMREFDAAVQSDSGRYLSLFYKTMLSPAARSNAPADQAEFEKALSRTLQLNPQFAQAYAQLSLLYARKGDDRKALAAASKAARLEPSRAGYDLLAASLLLRLGDTAHAATIAKYVADRWSGPDHDEAVDLLLRIPDPQRPPDSPVTAEEPQDTKRVEGTVTSVACKVDPKQKELTLTVQSNEQPLVFRDFGHGLKIGFPDTLWYGEDHFNLCHHIDGLRTIVRYKPAKDHSYEGDLVQVELRVDLPAPTSPTTDHSPGKQ